MKKFLSVVAGLALATTGLTVTAAQSQAATKPELTVAVVSPLVTWAPWAAEIGNRGPLYTAVYDTLFYIDSKGAVKPDLALSSTYDKTRTVLTVKLRKGVKFTDGTPFNAAAVIANVDAFRKSTSADLGQAASIVSVTQGKDPKTKKSDPYTVVYKLSDTDPSLVNNLARALGFIGSPAQIDSTDAKTRPVGTGAYVLDAANSVTDSSYVFTPNPNYWNKKVQYFSKLTVKIIGDANASINALKTGQVNMGSLINVAGVEPAKAAGLSLMTSSGSFAGLTLVDRSGKMGTALKNVNVRQAINYALDRPTILKVCAGGYGTPTSSIFPEANSGYSKAMENYYTYDPAKAKALLAAAGLSNVTIPSLDVSGFNPTCWAAWTQMLKDVGITVSPERSSGGFATIFQDLQQPKWPMFWFVNDTAPDAWQFINQEISRDAAWNPQSYGTRTTDKLIEQIRVTSGAAQAKLLTALNAEITKNAWFAPFVRNVNFFAYDAKKVKVTAAPGEKMPTFPYGVSPA